MNKIDKTNPTMQKTSISNPIGFRSIKEPSTTLNAGIIQDIIASTLGLNFCFENLNAKR